MTQSTPRSSISRASLALSSAPRTSAITSPPIPCATLTISFTEAQWARLMTTTWVAPAPSIISASSPAPSIVFRSATIGTPGNSFRRAFTAWRPSPRMRGVPASSQSTPARRAPRATSSASAIVVRSRETWVVTGPGMFLHLRRGQDGLDDLAPLHLLEAGLPVLKGEDTADERGDVERFRAEERDHPLPDRPVVAEAALQPDRLLDDRVEGEAERLRSPAHLRDVAGRPDELHRLAQRGRVARGVDDAVRTRPVALASPGPERLAAAAEAQAAVRARHLEAALVGLEAHERHLGPPEPGHR